MTCTKQNRYLLCRLELLLGAAGPLLVCAATRLAGCPARLHGVLPPPATVLEPAHGPPCQQCTCIGRKTTNGCLAGRLPCFHGASLVAVPGPVHNVPTGPSAGLAPPSHVTVGNSDHPHSMQASRGTIVRPRVQGNAVASSAELDAVPVGQAGIVSGGLALHGAGHRHPPPLLFGPPLVQLAAVVLLPLLAARLALS